MTVFLVCVVCNTVQYSTLCRDGALLTKIHPAASSEHDFCYRQLQTCLRALRRPYSGVSGHYGRVC
jgi:hypothetical protein